MVAFNKMADGNKPIAQCLAESDLTEEETALAMATLLDVAKNNVEIHKREETKAEWAIRMGYKITALETQVDALTEQIKCQMERQNRLITELMVGLNHFIDLCHKGRFAGSGDGPRLALVKPETTNN
jgi:hypothetical protein